MLDAMVCLCIWLVGESPGGFLFPKISAYPDGSAGKESACNAGDSSSMRGPSVRFLTRYDGEVSEPLVGRQGSRVTMQH